MAGRESKEVYLYDTDGKYLRKFVSISEFARTFQLDENLFSNQRGIYAPDVFEFEDGRVAALYRIGKIGINKYRQYKNSPYTKAYRGRRVSESKVERLKKVYVYNLDGELIAEFKSAFFACKLMGDKNIKMSKTYTDDGLYYTHEKL